MTFFSRWLEVKAGKPTLDELNRTAIREWLAILTDDHEPGTVKVRYRGLFRFCSWLVDEDELDEHPMTTLSPPSLKMKPVPVISDDELAALMKACAGKEFNDRRDEALIRLLLDCGVRVSEACGLRVDQVDLDQGMAIVKGKGSKVGRCTSVPAPRARSIGTYGCDPTIAGPISTRCSYPAGCALARRCSGAHVKIRGVMAGIDDLHPHRFRHTFAHDFLMGGGQERDLKRLAGWSSDVMLERYRASAADARAKAAAQRLKRGDRV